MINNTSTTSTSGTTLISEKLGGPPNLRPRCPPSLDEKATRNVLHLLSAAEIPLCQILKLDREVLHAGSQLLDASPEQVVEDRCRNRRRKPDRRRYQRLRYARRHRTQAGAPGVTQSLECVDNAPHRTEQTDKRRNRRHRSQPVHVHLQLGNLLADSQLETPLNSTLIHQRAALLDLPFDLAIAEIETRP